MQPRTIAELFTHFASSTSAVFTNTDSVHDAVCNLAEGQTQEVDEAIFEYFLDVLPPRDMGRGWFMFAEGEEPLRFFWKRSGRLFCRRLSWDETHEFMLLRRGGSHAPS